MHQFVLFAVETSVMADEAGEGNGIWGRWKRGLIEASEGRSSFC